jgi:L-ascorbate metabolism protein UlaG (beta-lactamase superfamily)
LEAEEAFQVISDVLGEDSFVADIYVITSPHRAHLVVDGARALLNWNVTPLTDPDLAHHLRSPLVTRPDVA